MLSYSVDFFYTNITAKILFPSQMTKNYWAIEELSEKKLYAVPFIGVLMVVACVKPISKLTLFEFLISKLHTDVERLENMLTSLISKNIIISSDTHEDFLSLFDKFFNWVEAGWGDAAHYHFFTWDTSSLDYSKEEHAIDRNRMVEYQSLQLDKMHYKKYDTALKNIPLPLLNFSFPMDQMQSYTFGERIKLLLSLTFGKTGEKPCHWSEIPFITRTSPSGGSRDPTEGYFLSYSLDDIESGFYHIQTDPISLCLISTDNQCLLNQISEDADFQIFGAIILTSVFERNMYRYQEPRTFRTIHMDVGHILATIEMLAKECFIKTDIHLNFNENAILQQIGTTMLEEGVLAIITLYEDKH